MYPRLIYGKRLQLLPFIVPFLGFTSLGKESKEPGNVQKPQLPSILRPTRLSHNQNLLRRCPLSLEVCSHRISLSLKRDNVFTSVGSDGPPRHQTSLGWDGVTRRKDWPRVGRAPRHTYEVEVDRVDDRSVALAPLSPFSRPTEDSCGEPLTGTGKVKEG